MFSHLDIGEQVVAQITETGLVALCLYGWEDHQKFPCISFTLWTVSGQCFLCVENETHAYL